MSNIRVHFVDDSSSLAHHGVKGQKWGVRKYQNEDGTYTEEGKKRYGELADEYDKNTYASNKKQLVKEMMDIKSKYDKKYSDDVRRISDEGSQKIEKLLNGNSNIDNNKKAEKIEKINKDTGKKLISAKLDYVISGRQAGMYISDKYGEEKYNEAVKYMQNKEKRQKVLATVGSMAGLTLMTAGLVVGMHEVSK